jgi:hypothetical protein
MATKSAKKKATKKPAQIVVNVDVDVTKKRKKNPPRTAFRKGAPNPHAFSKGQSGCPGGKPKNVDQLLSRSLRVALCDRAPNEMAEGFHLPHGASWAQCIARRILIMAVRGDLEAVKLIHAATEGTNSKISIDFPDAANVPPLFELVFVDAVDGRPAPGITIDAGRSHALPE